MTAESTDSPKNFIQQIIEQDLESGKHEQVVTRFPPEPNGYLHIGHAKAICVSYGLGEQYNGRYHLRFDDTNPEVEDVEYVESIQNDIRWLGFDWGDHLHFASDYFERIYACAVELIKNDKAYVCDLDTDGFAEYRGTPTEPGRETPHRNRPIEESLDLFERMRNGEFQDGTYVLRAKIDMASDNLHLRDPVIYRIKHAHHHRTGNTWCLYPMYDFTHPLSDAFECITHSLCSIEFEVHRPLYDWVVENCETPATPRQIEFARLALTYTVMSKRKLLQLVNEGLVSGWDDPRMPTLSGMRRRGYTPAAIRTFCDRVGVTKFPSTTDIGLLEWAVRDHLNKIAPRVMAVLNPLKVVITNYPEDEDEQFEGNINPEDEHSGTRSVPFSRELYIEREDFMEDPPRKFFRLAPGREVRLRYACLITCNEVIKAADGTITEIHCTWDPESRGGSAPDGRKVKSTLHWVSAKHALNAEVRLYDRLFKVESPDGDKEVDFKEHLNPDSCHTINALVEPSLDGAEPGAIYQFERLGYFCVDNKDSSAEQLVFNKTVGLRDSWGNKKQ